MTPGFLHSSNGAGNSSHLTTAYMLRVFSKGLLAALLAKVDQPESQAPSYVPAIKADGLLVDSRYATAT